MMRHIYRAIVVVTEPEHGEQQVLGGETVFEDDDSPIRTGLLDTRGVPIYRIRSRDPVGFRVRG